MSPNFNKEYAATVAKAQWVKEHEHLKDDFDLAAEWESVQPKKEVEKPSQDGGSTQAKGGSGLK